MGNFWHCTGLLLRALIAPDPRGDGTDDRLSTGLDVDVLDGDALLPLAAMAIQGFAQSRESLFAWFRFSRQPSKGCSGIIARRWHSMTALWVAIA